MAADTGAGLVAGHPGQAWTNILENCEAEHYWPQDWTHHSGHQPGQNIFTSDSSPIRQCFGGEQRINNPVMVRARKSRKMEKMKRYLSIYRRKMHQKFSVYVGLKDVG